MSGVGLLLSALGTDPLRLRARLGQATGSLRRRLRTLPGGLYVFNFHRIGDRGATSFDPNVFSCTQDNLDAHLRAIGSHFELIAPDDLDEAANARSTSRCALLTFDDGYLDNYTLALPVLLRHRVRALFFICTGFIDSRCPPWWDRVAAMVRHSDAERIELNGRLIALRNRPRDASIREVLREFKLIEAKSADKLAMLESRLQPRIPLAEERLFMDWEEVRSLHRQGMTIGSHTLTHDKLSHISPREAQRELAESKAILDRQLSQDTVHLAYPVGGYDSFTEGTVELARSLGYRFAFTTEQHVNRGAAFNPLALGRFSVSCESPALAQHLMLQHLSATEA